MESTVDSESLAPDNPKLEGSVGEKRPAAGESEEELLLLSAEAAKKKPRNGEMMMKRVAEIVMVLSAMSGIRGGGGGKRPTDTEVSLMAEARAKLVEICQDLTPKDLVARDAIGTVIEDLGLNWKVKDQRLGFRGSRLSIKEKLLLSKRKMEDSKKFATPSAAYTSQTMQPSFGAVGESRGPSHNVRMFPSDKPNNAPLPSGALTVSSSPLTHVTASTSPSVPHQPPTEVRASTVSTGLPGSHLGRDLSTSTVPRADKTHFKLEGGSNGTSNAHQVQGNASASHPPVNPPNWSMQPQSMLSTKSAPENKLPNHSLAKVEGTAELGVSRTAPQAASNQTYRHFVSQPASANLPGIHQPMQGMKYVQPSSFFNNHSEIAKIVQKLLQPKLPEHPTWTPPSRDYMNKALTCQMCKETVNDVETVVLCDACEKGYHLKCLEGINKKGIPRGEWHCMRCTALSNGKPFPPKYGRVMRSITPPKGPSHPAGAQLSLEKKVGTIDMKVNQEKITANGSSGLRHPAGSVTVGSKLVGTVSDSIVPNAREIPGISITLSVKDADLGTQAETFPNNLTKSLGSACESPLVRSSSERPMQQTQVSESRMPEERSVSESKLQPPAVSSDKFCRNKEDSKPSKNSQDIVRTEKSDLVVVPLETWGDHPVVKESESIRGNSGCTLRSDVTQHEQDIVHANLVGSSQPNNEDIKLAGMSSDAGQSVEWIGNVVNVVDGKKFYESCCIDGVRYKVQDHALFRSSHDKSIPSRLQAMWEDTKTGSKWIIVNVCYFPRDLPQAVGHPCAPESNEVYESNHQSSIMASMIQGPCEVLPPSKFKEKSERQSQLGTEANNGSRAIFLCKWFYDEVKGSFQPVFC